MDGRDNLGREPTVLAVRPLVNLGAQRRHVLDRHCIQQSFASPPQESVVRKVFPLLASSGEGHLRPPSRAFITLINSPMSEHIGLIEQRRAKRLLLAQQPKPPTQLSERPWISIKDDDPTQFSVKIMTWNVGGLLIEYPCRTYIGRP